MAQNNQESAPSKWPDLCNDLLYLIYGELDIFDFVRFRAVCKSWYNSIPVSDHRPQLPFLLADDFTAYSLLTGKTHTLRKPNNQSEMFFGQSSHGYLVTYGLLNFSAPHKPTGPPPCLFNPFTMVQRSLPFRDFSLYTPVFLGKDALPDFDDDIVIYMTSFAKGDNLTYWLKEEKKWHTVPLYLAGAKTIYKKRLFYYGHHLTTVLDLTTRYTLRFIPNPNGVTDFCCLVEAGGSLLGIVRRGNTSFHVYRLDEEEHKPPHWVQVSNIGDQMIFLNRDDGFSLPASRFDGISGNCIYFTKWNEMRKPHCVTSILRYDLRRRSSEVVGSSTQRDGTWILPNLCGKY